MALTLHCYLVMMVQHCPHSLMAFVITQYCLNDCDSYVQNMVAQLTLKIEILLLTYNINTKLFSDHCGSQLIIFIQSCNYSIDY